eukprot:Nk52_evm26s226 gene=Nk52_evmTU26s226
MDATYDNESDIDDDFVNDVQLDQSFNSQYQRFSELDNGVPDHSLQSEINEFGFNNIEEDHMSDEDDDSYTNQRRADRSKRFKKTKKTTELNDPSSPRQHRWEFDETGVSELTVMKADKELLSASISGIEHVLKQIRLFLRRALDDELTDQDLVDFCFHRLVSATESKMNEVSTALEDKPDWEEACRFMGTICTLKYYKGSYFEVVSEGKTKDNRILENKRFHRLVKSICTTGNEKVSGQELDRILNALHDDNDRLSEELSQHFSFWSRSNFGNYAKDLQDQIAATFNVLYQKDRTVLTVDDFKMYHWNCLFCSLGLSCKGHRGAHLGPTMHTIGDSSTGLIFCGQFGHSKNNAYDHTWALLQLLFNVTSEAELCYTAGLIRLIIDRGYLSDEFADKLHDLLIQFLGSHRMGIDYPFYLVKNGKAVDKNMKALDKDKEVSVDARGVPVECPTSHYTAQHKAKVGKCAGNCKTEKVYSVACRNTNSSFGPLQFRLKNMDPNAYDITLYPGQQYPAKIPYDYKTEFEKLEGETAKTILLKWRYHVRALTRSQGNYVWKSLICGSFTGKSGHVIYLARHCYVDDANEKNSEEFCSKMRALFSYLGSRMKLPLYHELKKKGYRHLEDELSKLGLVRQANLQNIPAELKDEKCDWSKFDWETISSRTRTFGQCHRVSDEAIS